MMRPLADPATWTPDVDGPGCASRQPRLRDDLWNLHRAVAFVAHAPRPVALLSSPGRAAAVLACVKVRAGCSAEEATDSVLGEWPEVAGLEAIGPMVSAYQQLRDEAPYRLRSTAYNFAPCSGLDAIVYGSERPGSPGYHRGGIPSAEVDEWVRFVRDQGIRRVICLLDRGALGQYRDDLLAGQRAAFDEALHVCIEDFSAPPVGELLRILAALESAEKAGHPVVVHCWAGLGRTGLALAAWLRHRHERGTDDAIELVCAHAASHGATRRPLEAGEPARRCLDALAAPVR